MPDFAVSEFELPAGCEEVTDNTDNLAAYAQNTGRAYPSSVLGLLDLKTGRHRIVLPAPVGSQRYFDAFTPMLSDQWIAWEEVSPAEASAPRDAEWRLYAASIDRARLQIGTPHLVDSGTTDYKLRPHYGVEGSTVYWSISTLPSHHQEYVATSGRILALDLSTGSRRMVYEGPRTLVALKISGGNAVVFEGPDDASGNSACRVTVLDISTGKIALTRELGPRDVPAHFADYAGGRLAWASFPAPGVEWPDLYVEAPGSRAVLAGRDSIDPVFFDRYLAYESVTATAPAPGGVKKRLRRIWGLDTSTPGQRFCLAETTGADGWWQTTRAGQTERTLVLWNSLGPWVADQAKARTLVRVYRAP